MAERATAKAGRRWGRARGPLPRRRSGPRAALPWVLWTLGTLAVAGALVAADRAWLARQVTAADPAAARDPAARVAGAVRSISGPASVRRSTYDPQTKTAVVEATSRYYDPRRPAAENRQYLATEGRLAAQLALHDHPAVAQVTVRFYAGQDLLATITARQGEAFEKMRVEYGDALAASQRR